MASEQEKRVAGFGSLCIPIRVRRPSAARETLRLSPLVQAGCADASGVEGVSLVAALAEPLVFFPWRPAAERAADARSRWIVCLFFSKLAVWNDDRIVCDRTRARDYDPRPDYLGSVRRFTEALAQYQPYGAAHPYSTL